MRITILIALFASTTLAQDVAQFRAANRNGNASIKTARVSFLIKSSREPADNSARLAEIGAKQPSMKQEYEELFNASALNNELEEMQVVLFSPAAESWVVRRNDLRKIDELMVRKGIPLTRRSTVDRGADILSTASFDGFYNRAAGVFSVARRITGSVSREALLCTPLKLGTLSDHSFDVAQIAGEIVGTADHPRWSFTFQSGESESQVEVDPALDFRYTHITYRHGQRTLEEDTATDYRRIDGVWIPFRHERTQWNPNGTLRTRELILIQDASFNSPIPKADLSLTLPVNTTVTDTSVKNVHRIKAPRTVTASELPQLAAMLEAEAKTTPPTSAPAAP